MNFIEVYENVISPQTCKNLITLFEVNKDRQAKGVTSGGENPKHKQDTEITIDYSFFGQKDWGPNLQEVISGLGTSLSEYKNKYSSQHGIEYAGINAIDPWSLEKKFNFQRFLPGEGYKVWHCESPNVKYSQRVLVWMVYLNDVTDKGGTEFLHQDVTLQAKGGTIVIWPPWWTHYHKSQVSPTQVKYIMTGWMEYDS